jgi:SAM-dependent methyltransferase
LEPVSAYVEFSRQNLQPNCDFVVGAAEEASRVISDRFDYIISNDVLHHVASFGAASKELAKLAKPGAVWLILEPNWKNPYVLLGSTQQPGERNFWPGAFERAAGEWGWRRCQKGHLFLIPPFIRSPPGWLKRLEKRWEGVPWLAGGVFLALTLQQRPE